MPRITNDLSARQLRWGLLAAAGLHFFILGLFVFSVIPQVYHPVDRLFWLHQGGDNAGYFAQARGLLTGNLEPNKYPLGFPLLLLPFMMILQPLHQEDLLEPVSAFWGLVMFPVGQLLLAHVAAQMTGRRWLALVSVFAWTALPLALYAMLRLLASPEAAEIGSSHLMWAQMLSDGPAALFTLLIATVFLRDSSGSRFAWLWAALLGFLCGFLMLIRLTGALTVLVVAVLLLARGRWRVLGVVIVTALIVFSPQMLYNAHFFGSPFTSGYQVLDQLPPRGLFHVGYLTDAVTRLGMLPSILISIPALILGGSGMLYLWRQNRAGAALAGLTLAAYVALYSVYYYSWTGSLTRFLIPVYPLIAVIAAGVVGLLVVKE